MTIVPQAPDFLGERARIDTVAGLIQAAQEQLQDLSNRMIVYGLDENSTLKVQDAADTTYGERMRVLRKGIADLMAKHSDIHEELIADAVRRRKAVEALIEKRQRGEGV